MMGGGYGGGSVFAILGFLTWIVWLIVGVMIIIWLWKQINK